jgi:hypothetical protein
MCELFQPRSCHAEAQDAGRAAFRAAAAQERRAAPQGVVFKEENGDGLTAKELQRRLSVRAAVSPAFITALRRDFARHGAVAIARTRDLAPATYVRLTAVLLPMDAETPPPAPEEPSQGAADAAAVAQRIAELRDFLARERDAAEDADPAA